MKYFTIVFIFLLVLIACDGNEKFIPKPPTFLKIQLPERSYEDFKDSICDFQFEKPNYFNVKTLDDKSCNKDIEFDGLNGTLHLSYIKMDTTLDAYVNYANDKVDEHKIKAQKIIDTNFLSPDNKVYGTFFELQGNVATPFQFYITDSTNNFASGVVYFNARPNYDSIKPVLDFVKKDLKLIMETFQWD